MVFFCIEKHTWAIDKQWIIFKLEPYFCTGVTGGCSSMYKIKRFRCPVSTRRRFDVYKTSITLKRRRMDVKTTLCAYWDEIWFDCILLLDSCNEEHLTVKMIGKKRTTSLTQCSNKKRGYFNVSINTPKEFVFKENNKWSNRTSFIISVIHSTHFRILLFFMALYLSYMNLLKTFRLC